MTIDSWDPTAVETFAINPKVLQKFADLGQSDALPDLTDHFTDEEIRQQAPIMRLNFSAWQQTADDNESSTLIALIRFFNLAEEQLPGWEGQGKSPVIYLNKLLKLRQEPLSKEMLLWIRKHSKNRFLPNGAL